MNKGRNNTVEQQNPAFSRRKVLGLAAAASAVPIAVTAAPFIDHAAGFSSVPTGASENPDLIDAYERFLAALEQEKAARDAVEWIADEWRHLWPLAPDELLENANAHKHGVDRAERDIAGHFLMRDTADVTKRLPAKFRLENQKCCFAVTSSDMAVETIAVWQRHIPKGRTEKSLARNCAYRDETIRIYQKKLKLALEYEAETTKLREASGIVKAQKRVSDANTDVSQLRSEISKIPAFTPFGLRIKAAVLMATGLFGDDWKSFGGPLGEMARFLEAVLDVTSSDVQVYASLPRSEVRA